MWLECVGFCAWQIWAIGLLIFKVNKLEIGRCWAILLADPDQILGQTDQHKNFGTQVHPSFPVLTLLTAKECRPLLRNSRVLFCKTVEIFFSKETFTLFSQKRVLALELFDQRINALRSSHYLYESTLGQFRFSIFSLEFQFSIF